MLPYGLTGLRIRLFVLGFPGKAGRHHLKLNTVRFEQVFFTVRPFPFDELYDRSAHPVTDGAGDGAEGRRGFAFAVAGENNQNSALFFRGVNACIDLFF